MSIWRWHAQPWLEWETRRYGVGIRESDILEYAHSACARAPFGVRKPCLRPCALRTQSRSSQRAPCRRGQRIRPGAPKRRQLRWRRGSMPPARHKQHPCALRTPFGVRKPCLRACALRTPFGVRKPCLRACALRTPFGVRKPCRRRESCPHYNTHRGQRSASRRASTGPPLLAHPARRLSRACPRRRTPLPPSGAHRDPARH